MRRWSLALLVTLATPAFAQAPEPAQAPPAAPAPEAKPPEKKAPAAAAPKEAPAAPAAAAKAPSPAPAEGKPAAAESKPAAAAQAPKPQAAAAPSTGAAAQAGAQAPIDEAEGERRKRVQRSARYVLESLVTGDARRAAGELSYPFQLEDKKYGTPEELVAAWVKQLRVKRTDLITLYDIEVLPLADMEKKYGKPPARLGLGNLKDPDVYVAVGNLSGHAAVMLFRAPKDGEAKAFAYTD